MTSPIIFANSAAAKVWELIQEEGNFNLKLRVYVTGGGCSGFQYGFKFDEAVNAEDMVISKALEKVPNEDEEEGDEGEGGGQGVPTVQLLVDPISLQYLLGAEISYKEDIEGAQFIIRNPNAKTTCGCGS
jgi:iron-sulfur cluster insertion protein